MFRPKVSFLKGVAMSNAQAVKAIVLSSVVGGPAIIREAIEETLKKNPNAKNVHVMSVYGTIMGSRPNPMKDGSVTFALAGRHKAVNILNGEEFISMTLYAEKTQSESLVGQLKNTPTIDYAFKVYVAKNDKSPVGYAVIWESTMEEEGSAKEQQMRKSLGLKLEGEGRPVPKK
jgi:hypothetical protein